MTTLQPTLQRRRGRISSSALDIKSRSISTLGMAARNVGIRVALEAVKESLA